MQCDLFPWLTVRISDLRATKHIKPESRSDDKSLGGQLGALPASSRLRPKSPSMGLPTGRSVLYANLLTCGCTTSTVGRGKIQANARPNEARAEAFRGSGGPTPPAQTKRVNKSFQVIYLVHRENCFCRLAVRGLDLEVRLGRWSAEIPGSARVGFRQTADEQPCKHDESAHRKHS